MPRADVVTLRAPPLATFQAFQGIAWLSATEFLVTGMDILDSPYLMLRFKLDNTYDVVWSSAHDWFFVIGASGSVAVGSVREVRSNLLILSPL